MTLILISGICQSDIVRMWLDWWQYWGQRKVEVR